MKIHVAAAALSDIYQADARSTLNHEQDIGWKVFQLGEALDRNFARRGEPEPMPDHRTETTRALARVVLESMAVPPSSSWVQACNLIKFATNVDTTIALDHQTTAAATATVAAGRLQLDSGTVPALRDQEQAAFQDAFAAAIAQLPVGPPEPHADYDTRGFRKDDAGPLQPIDIKTGGQRWCCETSNGSH